LYSLSDVLLGGTLFLKAFLHVVEEPVERREVAQMLGEFLKSLEYRR
jgi:hypothetical protein